MYMIKGIGIDLIELKRIEQAILKNARFVNRVLTEKEVSVYNEYSIKQRQIEFLAGRFAAKEAFSKAAGTGIGKLSFQDIQILNEGSGAPFISAKGFEPSNIYLSISHSKEYAVAQVIITA